MNLKAKRKQIEEERSAHTWRCVTALENALQITEHGVNTGGIDWGSMARAAFHAGAARVSTKILFDMPEE